MAHPSSAPVFVKSRYGARWLLVLVGGLAWLSMGCNPQTLSFLAMPFTDNKKDPDYKLFASDKEITLVVLSNFAQPQIHPEIMPADTQLAEEVSQALRTRCEYNKHKLKLVPQAQVRSYQLRQISEGELSRVDVGKKFKADYVLDMQIQKFGLYEPNSWPKMFRGTAHIRVELVKVSAKDDEHVVFSKYYDSEYPRTTGPIDAGNGNTAQFRRLFLSKVGQHISRMFVSYPPEEEKQLD